VLACDLIELRRLLLKDERVRERLDTLTDLRSGAARLAYRAELGRLCSDLDNTWTPAELDGIAAQWKAPAPCGLPPYRDQAADGIGLVGVGFTAGLPGRARHMTPAQVQMVANSIAAHATGLSWAEAHAQAWVGKPGGDMALAKYRQRLRDRIPPAPVQPAVFTPRMPVGYLREQIATLRDRRDRLLIDRDDDLPNDR
jgi:hypothetical protein